MGVATGWPTPVKPALIQDIAHMEQAALSVLIGLAVVAFFIIRRTMGQPLNSRRFWLIPGLLVVLGVISMTSSGGFGWNDAGWLALLSVIALVLGAVRGVTVHIYSRGGLLWFRYRPVTIAIWVGWFVVHYGLDWLIARTGSDIGTASSTFVVGLTLLGEAATLAPRAMSTGMLFHSRRRARSSRTGVSADTGNSSGNQIEELEHSPTVTDGLAWLRERLGRGSGDRSSGSPSAR